MSESKLTSYLESLVPRPGKLAAHEVVAAASLNPQKVRKVAHVQKLAELTRQNVRIVGRDDLDRDQLLRADCEAGARLWILESPADARAAEQAFPKACRDLGGGVVGIHPPNLLRSRLEKTPAAASEYAGMNTVRVPQDIVDRLTELQVPTRRASWLSRLIKNPQTLVYLVVFVYSSLRALPVVFVKEFHGSVLLLWTIDVVTAVPYTWGVLAMVLAKQAWKRVLGAVTTIVTFMAPYIYFWLHGDSYPWYVTVIVAFLVFTGVAMEIAKYVQEKTLERKYSSARE